MPMGILAGEASADHGLIHFQGHLLGFEIDSTYNIQGTAGFVRISADGAEAQSGKGILSNASQQINISKGGVQNKNKHMGQVQPAKGTAYLLKAVAVDKYSRSY